MKAFGNLTVQPMGDKTPRQWLRRVYLDNKKFIDQRTGDYKTFVQATQDYVIDIGGKPTGLSWRQGLQKLSRSSAAGFQGRNELQQSLFEGAITGRKREFKKLTGERFNAANVHYNSKTKEWDYTSESTGEVIAHFSDIRKTGYRAGQARFRI